jgi:hypothetical protein
LKARSPNRHPLQLNHNLAALRPLLLLRSLGLSKQAQAHRKSTST